jgi:hypothetical protein|tara:strand:+ start:196 stop:471 length:276 start_codon:yes stop_codon:yes gene_type:complete
MSEESLVKIYKYTAYCDDSVKIEYGTEKDVEDWEAEQEDWEEQELGCGEDTIEVIDEVPESKVESVLYGLHLSIEKDWSYCDEKMRKPDPK